MNTNFRRSTFLLGSLAVLTALIDSTASAQYFTDPNAVYGQAPPPQQQQQGFDVRHRGYAGQHEAAHCIGERLIHHPARESDGRL